MGSFGEEEGRQLVFLCGLSPVECGHKEGLLPLPRIDDAFYYILGSSWFSSLDLRSGYWQVELAPDARPKTAFTIGQGRWQFHVMPFGLCNAPATFERLMERVLVDVPRSCCVVYLDDLLVHASNFERALANLPEVLTAFRQAGLKLNPASVTCWPGRQSSWDMLSVLKAWPPTQQKWLLSEIGHPCPCQWTAQLPGPGLILPPLWSRLCHHLQLPPGWSTC